MWRGCEKSSWCVSSVVIRCCFYFRSHSGSDLQTDEAQQNPARLLVNRSNHELNSVVSERGSDKTLLPELTLAQRRTSRAVPENSASSPHAFRPLSIPNQKSLFGCRCGDA